jgi:hypothetical protein
MVLLPRLTAAQVIFFIFAGKYSTVVHDELGKWARRKFSYRRRNLKMKSCFADPIDGNNKRTLHVPAILSNGKLWGDLERVRMLKNKVSVILIDETNSLSILRCMQ